nr:hypothetical protein [Candidatus Sigynarchaeum springense]MDO8115981.1 hypothetical protein [Candidatus Sigynarchaeota archaeon]
MPTAGHPGIFGWLEAVGPTIDGQHTPIRIDDPNHPYMLAANLHDGTITTEEYEAGMMRVLGWFLEFVSEPSIGLNPGLYDAATNPTGVVPVSTDPHKPYQLRFPS